MVDPDLVATKLSELSERVERVRSHRAPDAAALAADRDALDIVSFNLMLAVQTCADVASHVASDEGWPVARTLAEGFARLEEHGVLAAPTAAALKRAVGLRNVVAHGYARVDPELVHRASHEGLEDLSSFAREVSAWVRRRGDAEEE
ncbi:MAG: DUF86 domain-containing protein [Sandaracinaceae bacterium]|nr:DUF86 domain-containing protein [Sandaracinaceae bacterium]